MDQLKAGLKAISEYPNEKQMFDFCRLHEIRFADQEPPYLTQARIAEYLLKQQA